MFDARDAFSMPVTHFPVGKPTSHANSDGSKIGDANQRGNIIASYILASCIPMWTASETVQGPETGSGSAFGVGAVGPPPKSPKSASNQATGHANNTHQMRTQGNEVMKRPSNRQYL